MDAERALRLEPGTRVIATIPEDSILAPYRGPGVFVEERDGQLVIQLQGWVPAHSVRSPSGATGPGFLNSPLVELEPQHVELADPSTDHDPGS